MTAPHIMLIAGEASGDRLGGALMQALTERQTSIRFSGIGGDRMREAGLASLFPMEELSLMGFAEILPHIFRLRQRIHEAVQHIEKQKPDMLVTIDSPGFNFRVVAELKKRGIHRPKLVHYVAPTVWAYKPQRAAKTAALFDHMMVILPFEPPYFTREGMDCIFVGHPVTDTPFAQERRAEFRKALGAGEADTLLCLLPGSRKGELQRHLPIYRETAKILTEYMANIKLVMPVLPSSKQLVEQEIAHWKTRPFLVTGEQQKQQAMVASDVALAKSGTITLEAAMAGLPMVTTYRVHPLSAWLVRRMLKAPYVNLINILLGREVVQEFLQERCRKDLLAGALFSLISDTERRHAQQQAYTEALALLRPPGSATAASTAANTLLQWLE